MSGLVDWTDTTMIITCFPTIYSTSYLVYLFILFKFSIIYPSVYVYVYHVDDHGKGFQNALFCAYSASWMHNRPTH